MGPLACQTPVAGEIAIIGRVNNDGVVGQACVIECLQKPADRLINTADHSGIGLHVQLVLQRRVPPPEEPLAIDRGLKKVRQGGKDRGVVQPRRRKLDILVHARNRLRPRKVADARSPISVFGMAGVEPEVDGKGPTWRLSLEELDATVNDELSFMPQAAVRLPLVIRVAADRLKCVEMVFRPVASGHLGVPLPKEAGAVAMLPEQIRIEAGHRLGPCQFPVAWRSIAAAGLPGQDARAADPANRLAHERVLKPRPSVGEAIEMRGLHDLIAIAAEACRGLIVRKEEDDVGLASVIGERH